eukprot:scaffold625_cov420-Prasinococcus_capsulatus_cf.AAC.53
MSYGLLEFPTRSVKPLDRRTASPRERSHTIRQAQTSACTLHGSSSARTAGASSLEQPPGFGRAAIPASPAGGINTSNPCTRRLVTLPVSGQQGSRHPSQIPKTPAPSRGCVPEAGNPACLSGARPLCRLRR